MQLRKNLNLYLSGIVVFTLTILLLSTAFALDESLGNRIAKIFWFYKVIIVAGIACIPLAWMRPFRFSITDLLVLLYAGYTLCNDYFAGTIAPTRTSLFILIIVTYFIFRRLTTFAPLGFTHAALLLTGAIEAIWGLAQLYGFTPSQHSRFELTGSFFNPGPYSGFLVAILPLALYYTLTACRIARILSGVILVLLLLVLPATLSRGAWLAAIAGCGIVLGNYFHLYNRLKFLFQKHRLLHRNDLYIPPRHRDSHRDIPVKKRICRWTPTHLESLVHPCSLPSGNRRRVRAFCRGLRGSPSRLFLCHGALRGRRTRGRCPRDSLQRIRANHDRNRNHRFITFPDNHFLGLQNRPAF